MYPNHAHLTYQLPLNNRRLLYMYMPANTWHTCTCIIIIIIIIKKNFVSFSRCIYNYKFIVLYVFKSVPILVHVIAVHVVFNSYLVYKTMQLNVHVHVQMYNNVDVVCTLYNVQSMEYCMYGVGIIHDTFS